MSKEEPKPIPVAIQRLIEEVRTGVVTPTRYNRVYHRHNRS